MALAVVGESVTDMVELTPDQRWIVVDGRRWRATDPDIPPKLRQELVDELMAQRRAIGAARRDDTRIELDDLRRRVHLAKVALGERGEPWWEPTDEGLRERLRAAILTLAGHRYPEGTICVSDAARAVGGASWRRLLPMARAAAGALAEAGEVAIRQRGEIVEPLGPWRGPIRIGLSGRPGSGPKRRLNQG